jgi:hypothetical protein
MVRSGRAHRAQITSPIGVRDSQDGSGSGVRASFLDQTVQAPDSSGKLLGGGFA